MKVNYQRQRWKFSYDKTPTERNQYPELDLWSIGFPEHQQILLLQSQYDDGTDTTRRQLLSSCSSLQSASDQCIDSLLDVWRGVVHRIYHYYQLSASSYFKFLKLNGGVSICSIECSVILPNQTKFVWVFRWHWVVGLEKFAVGTPSTSFDILQWNWLCMINIRGRCFWHLDSQSAVGLTCIVRHLHW